MPPFENDCDLAGLYGILLDDDDVDIPPRTPSPVPLIGVQVNVQTLDFIAQVQISQSYHNDSYNTLEAVYHFPIYEGAAVCGFEAEYEDGRKVKGVVKEKETARQEYNHAKQQGKQANLLESVRRDVFTLKVGNIPPDGFVKINITYVTTLEARDDSIALVLPTSIAPRYTPPSPASHSLYSSDHHQAQQALAPPTTPVKWYGLDIQVYVKCRSNIATITCPTHNDVDLVTTNGKTGHLSLNDIRMDRDVVIKIKEERAHQPRASIEMSEDGTTMTGFVTFYPEIEFPDQNNREFIFIVDQSGSMAGGKIAQARETLLLFLRSLPPTCKFNIIGFGSAHRSLFSTPQPYNDDTLDRATKYVSSMRADLGGTEVVSPLKAVFQHHRPSVWKKIYDDYSGDIYYYDETTGDTSWEKPSPPPKVAPTERQVFILTDGQVSNDKQVFDLINQNCTRETKNRLFSVGIGDSVSRHLVSGMARAGRGTAQFVEEDGSASNSDALRVKVLGQLKQALQPSLDDVSIEWRFPQQQEPMKSLIPPQPAVKTLLGYRSPNVNDASTKTKQHPKPKMYPSLNPPIFSKHKYLSFAMFPRNCSTKPEGVTVKCITMDGPLVLDLNISEDEVFHGSIARKLAARTAISEFEDSRKGNVRRRRSHSILHTTPSALTENEALRLALDNSLASEITSFLAVSEDPVVNRWAPRHTQVVPQQAKVPPAPHPYTSGYGKLSAPTVTHQHNGLRQFSCSIGSNVGYSGVSRYGDGFVSSASPFLGGLQTGWNQGDARGPPPAPAPVLSSSGYSLDSSNIFDWAKKTSNPDAAPQFLAMNMSMPPPPIASSAGWKPAQMFSAPPPTSGAQMPAQMFSAPPPPSGAQMPAQMSSAPPPPPACVFHPPTTTMQSIPPPPPPSTEQFVGVNAYAAPVAPASTAPKVLAKGGMKLGMGSAGKTESLMAAMAAEDNLHPIAGVAPKPLQFFSAAPPRTQKLKMEMAKRQTTNRVWDDVDQRWVGVEKGSAKALGIKLDGSAAVGKSYRVQAAVSRRVNEMRENQQKAVQERNMIECKKKRDAGELEAVRQQLEPKIKQWSEEHGQKKQLRSLLATLHTVLWPGTKWKPLDIGNISEDGKVRRAFNSATLIIHPDKTHHLPADQRYLAKRIFDILVEAKFEFDDSPRERVTGRDSNVANGTASDGNETIVAGDKMLSICILQRANGSFELDDSLSQAIGVSRLVMDAMVNQLGSPSPAVFATALAVVVLRVEFAKKRNVWELQEEKALAFLASAAVSSDLLSRVEAEVRALSV